MRVFHFDVETNRAVLSLRGGEVRCQVPGGLRGRCITLIKVASHQEILYSQPVGLRENPVLNQTALENLWRTPFQGEPTLGEPRTKKEF